MRWKLLQCFLLVLLLAACSPQSLQSQLNPPLVYRGQFIVKTGPAMEWCDDSSQPEECQTEVQGRSYLVSPVGEYSLIRREALSASSTEPEIVPYDAKEDICITEEIEDCSPNYVISIDSNDPLFDSMWNLQKAPGVNIAKAWDIMPTASNVTIAVLDTGVNCDHEDIFCVGGYNAITNEEGIDAQMDDNGHGTHVAGTACAIGGNSLGVTGLAQRCRILGVKFLSKTGGGTLFAAIRGIEWAIENNADIINASWGGGGFSKPLYDKIQEARDRGILFVAAAGNKGVDNDLQPHYPSSYDVDNVVSVASIDHTGELSSFSNYGKTSVDLAAPGRNIYSAWYQGGYSQLSGTSMATPHVSGALALLLQQEKLAPALAVQRLLSTTKGSRELEDKVLSKGNLEAYRLLVNKARPFYCKPNHCQKCVNQCKSKYKCNFRKQRGCRSNCRINNACKKGCE